MKNKDMITPSYIQFVMKSMAISKRNQIMDKKYGIIKSNILRGKLGIDNIFLGIAILGIFVIPSYFYFKDRKVKEKIAKFRKERLEQYPDLDLDEISLDFTPMNKKEIDRRALERAKLEYEKSLI